MRSQLSLVLISLIMGAALSACASNSKPFSGSDAGSKPTSSADADSGNTDSNDAGCGTSGCQDLCPEDPQKTQPGICGCGVSDSADSDADGVVDCQDGCPTDPEPGQCGSGSGDNGKLKIFILAGQSNMVGYGKVDLGGNPNTDNREPNIIGGLGSLRSLVNDSAPKYDYLVDVANPISYPNYTGATAYPGWVTRSDVWVSYWTSDDLSAEQTRQQRNGGLTVGFGGQNTMPEGYIGPEYGFGQVVGNAMSDPVLLIKVAWGGKSLAVDFRPPSSGGTVGPFYSAVVSKAHQVINDLKTYYPAYNDAGYEIAGFGWHQGWNDRVNAAFTAEYEQNLANLIRDIRREFQTPKMPFVIANTGMANPETDATSRALIQAQGDVSDPVKYPEFAGTVTTVDTRPFYHENESPTRSFGYHWCFNGKSYFQIGESMGLAMLRLISAQ